MATSNFHNVNASHIFACSLENEWDYEDESFSAPGEYEYFTKPYENLKMVNDVLTIVLNDGTNDFYLIKDAPIPSGSALQVLDGGAKVVVQSGDILKVVSNTASSLDTWISTVDAIS